MIEKVNVLGLFERDRLKAFRPEIKFPVVTKEEISHLDFYHYTGLELQNVVARALERGEGADLYSVPVDMQWMAQMDKRDREEERERKRRERQGRDDDDFHWD